MMARGPLIAASVVSVLAGHAHAQPSATPPTPPPPQQQPSPSTPAEEPPPQTVCFLGRPFECASVFLLEFGARGDAERSVTTGNVGLLIHDGSNAYGGTIGIVGITDAEVGVMYAARYRRYLGSWGMAGDVSVGYAGGPMLEVAIGWGDVVALTVGANHYQLEDGDRDLIATAGVRVGSVTIGGLFYAAALVLTASR